LRHVDAAHAAGMPAIVSDNERGEVRELSDEGCGARSRRSRSR